MSLTRSRIASNIRRALACRPALQLNKTIGCTRTSSHHSSGDCAPSSQSFGRTLGGCPEFKRMASTIAETVAPSIVEKKVGDKGHTLTSIDDTKVVFVLGGPGSGKGTQCALIVEHFGFTHLSAGDLLRAEINSGNENGIMIQNMIKEGQIVPSEVTVKLLQTAMLKSGNDKFLIDGFPRNEQNRDAFERVTRIKPEFILFFDCPEEEMERRLLGRNQGRVDDNIETIRKRFKVFVDSSLPVINYYDSYGKVRKIDAARRRDEVFETVKSLFVPFKVAA